MAPSSQSLATIYDSQESIKPIPAFYCCYLLRSTVRHASLYIGSTPDPNRRLAQHNGDRNGGAKRTSREKLRPWEMVVIVSGFMSRVGALQFEWAWQNTQGSRHAEIDKSGNQKLARTGKEIKRAGKPCTSLTNILANLHLLLRSSYFSEWPLEVRFSSADVYGVWQLWSQRTDGLLDDGIKVVTAFDSDKVCDIDRDKSLGRAGNVEALDVSYDALKEYVEKSQFLLEAGEQIDCGVCKQRLNLQHDMIAVCSHNLCRCASHLLCLSSHFLEATGFDGKLVPREGTCPACHKKLEWPILMKEITLRLRGQEEIKRLFRRRRRAEGARKGQSLNSEDESDASKTSTALRNCAGLWVDNCNVMVIRSSFDRGGDTNSDNDYVRTITPGIELYQRRPNTKTKRLIPYKCATANKSDWDNVEIIE
ncbi:hypothetical protein EMCG_00002 [[Emmonsia] crescens]|uniref:GIY-YIG domain-containing protein n=1 Tax=[Emmonsia] crescens TaxID=73230 RepID=A0A0G2JC93_9EURO|nr:hypothetical protein EMCG_00002 [Emmonsia crescens UAMH 3008]